jgi:hypothetical protein
MKTFAYLALIAGALASGLPGVALTVAVCWLALSMVEAAREAHGLDFDEEES